MVVQEMIFRLKPVYSLAIVSVAISLSSCQNHEAPNDSEVEEEASIKEEVVQKSFPMSDFTAFGNEPYWRLDIDFEEGMYLSGLSVPEEIKADLPEREELEKGGFRYSAQVVNGTLTVEVIPGKCTDSMSGDEFPFTVKCSTEDSEYLGCGNFNADSALVGGMWSLVSMNDENLGEKAMTLSLDTRIAGISGSDGCNRFFGKAEITNERLLVGPGLGSTLMACEDMDISQKYTKFLTSGELQIIADGDRLTISNDSGSLKFKRQ